jgi:hypothetical protein
VSDRELMQMALDALSMAVEPKKGKVYAFEFQPIDCAAMHFKAIEALRTRLAQPEPETCGYDETTGNCTQNPCCYPASPQRKEWQELSDYDVDNIVKASSGRESAVYLAEAKLKEKNHD